MANFLTTIRLRIPSKQVDEDVTFFLNGLSYLGAEEKSDVIDWYWDEIGWSINKESIDQYLSSLGIDFTVFKVPGKNWNASWEESFSPVSVGSFCHIRAHFHPQRDECLYDIEIDPKMAFGTGHHDTTYQMVAAMQSLPIKDANILDLGTGTGILAILAEKLGANQIKAIDNEAAAVENAKENAALNGCNQLEVYRSDITTNINYILSSEIILANINRNVLFEIEASLSSKARPETILLMSGILEKDEKVILDKYSDQWKVAVESQKGDWLCILGRKY
jgi:ribosomal protein L11 methyltransferase